MSAAAPATEAARRLRDGLAVFPLPGGFRPARGAALPRAVRHAPRIPAASRDPVRRIPPRWRPGREPLPVRDPPERRPLAVLVPFRRNGRTKAPPMPLGKLLLRVPVLPPELDEPRPPEVLPPRLPRRFPPDPGSRGMCMRPRPLPSRAPAPGRAPRRRRNGSRAEPPRPAPRERGPCSKRPSAPLRPVAPERCEPLRRPERPPRFSLGKRPRLAPEWDDRLTRDRAIRARRRPGLNPSLRALQQAPVTAAPLPSAIPVTAAATGAVTANSATPRPSAAIRATMSPVL